MNIRKAASEDLDAIMEIYNHAKQFMVKTGNVKQWGDGYPQRDLMEQDVAQGVCYVCEDNQGIQAVFTFIQGNEPTYTIIENGTWKNENPYGTIHRLASTGAAKGVTALCIGWCFGECENLRADTHDDNKIMQHLLEKNGFEKCGRIYLGDGTSRIAYQKVI